MKEEPGMLGEDQSEGVVQSSIASPYLAGNKNIRSPDWTYDSDRENYRKGSEVVLGSPRADLGRASPP